jgi:hypothetical protein
MSFYEQCYFVKICISLCHWVTVTALNLFNLFNDCLEISQYYSAWKYFWRDAISVKQLFSFLNIVPWRHADFLLLIMFSPIELFYSQCYFVNILRNYNSVIKTFNQYLNYISRISRNLHYWDKYESQPAMHYKGTNILKYVLMCQRLSTVIENVNQQEK